METKQALSWIIDFLESNNIQYLICGGLAAIAYGSNRPLHDIDLYVPEQHYQSVIEFGHTFISYGPDRFCDKHWNIEYVQFNYKGQKIEVGSSKDIKIFNSNNHEWHHEILNFNLYTEIIVLGKKVRIMDKEVLVNYKTMLNRKVDKEDIQQINSV